MKRAPGSLRDVGAVFADQEDPERLTHRVILRSVEADAEGTTYRFSHLTPLKSRKASSPRLTSTGGPMTRKHAYSVVFTPRFLGSGRGRMDDVEAQYRKRPPRAVCGKQPWASLIVLGRTPVLECRRRYRHPLR